MPSHQCLDHLILFVPADPQTLLPRVPSYLADNFTLAPGGFHADGATSNVLIILSDGCYIELISFVPTALASLVSSHWWGPSYTFVGWKDWCLTNSLPPCQNYDDVRESHGEPIHGGRKRADGVQVKWSVTFPRGDKGGQDARGRIPFFCHDETERGVRVPMEEEKTRHACGAVGVKELTVIVKDQDLLEQTSKIYRAMIGDEGWKENFESRFRLGRVQGVPGLREGVEVVLRLPRNEEEEARVAEGEFWYGDVVLYRKAERGDTEKTRKRVDVEDGEEGVGGLWLEEVVGL